MPMPCFTRIIRRFIRHVRSHSYPKDNYCQSYLDAPASRICTLNMDFRSRLLKVSESDVRYAFVGKQARGI